MYNRENERQQFEDWHRHGRERGWFDRASDKFRSWFGDEDAEQRRRIDHIERNRDSRHSMHDDRHLMHDDHSDLPVWQQRDYSGPSPRGSELNERGRFGMDDLGGRRSRPNRGNMGYGYGSGYNNYGAGSRNVSYGNFDDYEYGAEYGGNRLNRMEREHYNRLRDEEMYGQLDRYGRGRENFGERNERTTRDELARRGGGFGRQIQEERGVNRQRGLMGGEHRGGLFGDREESLYRSGERGGFFGGINSGRGPRNFQRSDERISDEIHQVLTFHPEIDATDIDVLVEKGIVTLRGKVDNRMSKRLSEDLVEEIYGVREVRNELRVDNGLLNRTDENEIKRNNLLTR